MISASVDRPRKTIHLIQGEHCILSDPEAVVSTLLGSCVAACLRDHVAGVGGMNHFLLPGNRFDEPNGSGERAGVHAMELLVNGLLRAGAQRYRLEAKLFGGARMIKGLTDVGEMNATFAERFLRAEGIPLVGGSLRGERGRRIQFWPVSGRARQSILDARATVSIERRQPAPAPIPAGQGAVELF